MPDQGRTAVVTGASLGIGAVPMLNWARAELRGGLNPYPAAAAHHARMLSDPAVRRVMEAEAPASGKHA